MGLSKLIFEEILIIFISWGTREAKNPNKSFKKPEGAAARDEKSIQWTFDIFQNPVQPASPEEENFWKKTIEEFLKPRKPTEEEEDVMKKDLRLMKIGAIIVLSLFYIGYVLLMVLKKASSKIMFAQFSKHPSRLISNLIVKAPLFRSILFRATCLSTGSFVAAMSLWTSLTCMQPNSIQSP